MYSLESPPFSPDFDLEFDAIFEEHEVFFVCSSNNGIGLACIFDVRRVGEKDRALIPL